MLQVLLSSFLDTASLILNGENADLLRVDEVYVRVIEHVSDDGDLDGVVLDRPLRNTFEEEAFDILMSQFDDGLSCDLTVPKDADVAAIPALLQRGLPTILAQQVLSISFHMEIRSATTEQAHACRFLSEKDAVKNFDLRLRTRIFLFLYLRIRIDEL